MQWNLPLLSSYWARRLGTLCVFLSLGASLAYWTLQWPADLSALPAAPPAGAAEALPGADAGSLERLLGARANAAASAASGADHLRLVGVVARSHGAGAALIAPDGLPPRSYAVGSVLPNGLVLQSVTPRQALLSGSMQAPVRQTLELPAPRTPD